MTYDPWNWDQAPTVFVTMVIGSILLMLFQAQFFVLPEYIKKTTLLGTSEGGRSMCLVVTNKIWMAKDVALPGWVSGTFHMTFQTPSLCPSITEKGSLWDGGAPAWSSVDCLIPALEAVPESCLDFQQIFHEWEINKAVKLLRFGVVCYHGINLASPD